MAMIDQKDLDLLKIAQDGVLLTSRPYQVLGDLVGISEQEVIVRLCALQEAGIIRRFAATIGHRALGIVANAMIAWKAAPGRIEIGMPLLKIAVADATPAALPVDGSAAKVEVGGGGSGAGGGLHAPPHT